MSDIAIKVENVSKLYKLGDVGTGSLGDDIRRWWAMRQGKEDPYAVLAQANDRSKKAQTDHVWSLRDINFEIKKGDSVGIIGKNGAGKSTLLKILSRTTSPTTGSVKINGRVSSLLEVGTGFHGDLSGRANIYMNGAILGMTRSEITSKMEEIIDFSGVEGYIDTPVKRYSSGMYVRLAFAVAAHLDPDIMIVDEVLAVGDAEFQKKCLGKMQDVNSKEGRTVIFVTHTMSAIRQLCSKVILLKNGETYFNGNVNEGISFYLERLNDLKVQEITFEPKDKDAYFSSIKIEDEEGNPASNVNYDKKFFVIVRFTISKSLKDAEVSICLRNSSSVNVFFTSLSEKFANNLVEFKKGEYESKIEIEGNFLIPDNYYVSTYIHYRNYKNIDHHEDVLKLTIEETGSIMAPYGSAALQFACVFGKTNWELKELSNAI